MNRKSPLIFTAFFLLLVVLPGFLSFLNQMIVYVHHTVVDNEWTAELGSKFETDLAANFFRKFDFIDMNGAIRKALGQREMNGTARLNNGYLITPMKKCPEEHLRQFAGRTAAFHSFLEERGTELVYVSPPCTSDKYDPEMPAGIEDFCNENIDRLLSFLKDEGIDTIDVRETMRTDDISHYSMMYRTDHHWTTEAGFYTYGLLEKYIAEKTGCGIDPRVSDISNYTVTKYENWFLGSRGKRTGCFFAGADDFTLIEPDFETMIRRPDGGTGTIPDSFIDKRPLDRRNYETGYTYDTVLGEGAYLGDYVNLRRSNDVKVMVISDSYAKAVNPYLIMGFGEMKCVLDGYVGYITPEFVEEYDPDVVVMLYYPDYINADSGSFDFSGF